jgi:hypothetical protein
VVYVTNDANTRCEQSMRAALLQSGQHSAFTDLT